MTSAFKFYLGLLFLSIHSVGMTAIAQAQPTPPLTDPIIQFTPPNEGEPDKTASGATRGGLCGGDEPSGITATALIPLQIVTNENEQPRKVRMFQAVTTDLTPSLYFYLPATTASQLYVYVTETAADYSLPEITIPLADAGPGILEIPLSDQQRGTLSPNTQYHWSIQADCGGGHFTPLLDQGSLQTIDPLPASPTVIEAAKARCVSQGGTAADCETLAIAAGYARNGLWIDTLAILAPLMRNETVAPIIRDNWTSLLQQGELEEIAPQPLLTTQ
jgi:hypothetical protein